MHSGVRITVNVAQSINGIISGNSGKRARISDNEDLKRVHRLRSESDVILVGANTIISDNPKLRVDRAFFDSDALPFRVILDRDLRIPEKSNVLDSTARTIVFTSRTDRKLEGAELVYLDEGQEITGVVDSLAQMGIRSVLVEGGATVISQFVSQGIVDEFFLYIGNVILPESGVRLFKPDVEIRDVMTKIENLGDGILISIDPAKIKVKI